MICIEPLRLQVTLPLHLAAVGADVRLLLQTHQVAQTQFHRLPFAKGTGGLHRLPRQGVVSANQRIRTGTLKNQAPKAQQIAKQAELNFAVQGLRIQLEKARARL